MIDLLVAETFLVTLNPKKLNDLNEILWKDVSTRWRT